MDVLKEYMIENHRELVDDFCELHEEELNKFVQERGLLHGYNINGKDFDEPLLSEVWKVRDDFAFEKSREFLRFVELIYNAGEQ